MKRLLFVAILTFITSFPVVAQDNTREWKWEQEWISRDPDVNIDYTSTFKLYQNILSLQHFFKYHKIPYLMYWALSNDLQQDGDLIKLKDAVDRKHFYNFEESEHVKENIKRYNEMKIWCSLHSRPSLCCLEIACSSRIHLKI